MTPTRRERPKCEAVKRNGTPCGNLAQWLVTFREPEVPGVLRRQVATRRCLAHSVNEAFYPAGATQITERGAWDAVILAARGVVQGET